MQLLDKCALCDQGSEREALLRLPGLQWLTHSPQKVHSAFAKLTTGSFPLPNEMICCGQTEMQSPQLVQTSSKSVSGMAQGGRTGFGLTPERPLNRFVLA